LIIDAQQRLTHPNTTLVVSPHSTLFTMQQQQKCEKRTMHTGAHQCHNKHKQYLAQGAKERKKHCMKWISKRFRIFGPGLTNGNERRKKRQATASFVVESDHP
jgi:hypothetical protein